MRAVSDRLLMEVRMLRDMGRVKCKRCRTQVSSSSTANQPLLPVGTVSKFIGQEGTWNTYFPHPLEHGLYWKKNSVEVEVERSGK